MFKQNQDIFNTLAEALAEGVILVDKSQTIVATNSSTDTIFGYEHGELEGQTLEILIPKDYHGSHEGHFKGYVKNTTKRQMAIGRDLYGLKKSGVTFPVEVGLNPLTIYGNTYVLALVKDITERKKAEQELSHWANIFNESLNEIYIFDCETYNFVNVNRGAQKNIGYDLAELKTLTPLDIKPHYTKAQFIEKVKPLIDGLEEKLIFETVHQRKDGTTYPVEIHLQLSILGNKKVFVAVILDITERKNYTEKLESTVEKRTIELKNALAKEQELNELKTKFLSLVSHEFKTPLSGILTSTVLMSKYTLTEQQEKRDKHIKTIGDKVQYLNSILNDFLSLERLESGKLNYNFTEFKLSKVIDEVIYNANMLLKEGQSIKYPEHIDDFSLYQDEKSIVLILSNLLNNAIMYSQEHKTIAIMVNQNKTTTTIKIKDEGLGIPKKDQINIFDRYYRAENVSNIQGTGIGLNIVKNHIENLGGNITFESEEQIGTTFTITLPNSAAK
ncbi:PAS domain S-box-containing protein [Winogradskyella eximia]|uniref:histidine kinase n=1 Tax=Winogradskyella eximia TaxID=262006 RepID=A0A3D9H4I6_9FLAO|nr:PAS domain-containing sensor histidine kinase [Winogradskyella eximia]RED43846.1 PAS domain S-box-containing protein [Winogradskyella eximia]